MSGLPGLALNPNFYLYAHISNTHLYGVHLPAYLYTHTYICLDSIYYVSILIYTYTHNRHIYMWFSC